MTPQAKIIHRKRHFIKDKLAYKLHPKMYMQRKRIQRIKDNECEIRLSIQSGTIQRQQIKEKIEKSDSSSPLLAFSAARNEQQSGNVNTNRLQYHRLLAFQPKVIRHRQAEGKHLSGNCRQLKLRNIKMDKVMNFNKSGFDER